MKTSYLHKLQSRLHLLIQSIVAEFFRCSKLNTLSLNGIVASIIWPLLGLLTTLFTYKSFNLKLFARFGINSYSDFLIFLLTGFVSLSFYSAMTTQALSIQRDREDGTLQIIYISPANRFGLLLGRALSGLPQIIFSFVLIYFYIFLISSGKPFIKIMFYAIAGVLLFISASLWGTFMCALYLVSRNTSIWYILFNTPMEYLSGVSIPIRSFPKFLYVLSFIFPLTYTLQIVRKLSILSWPGIIDWLTFILVNFLCFFFTLFVINKSENNSRKSGTIDLF
ncbi:ABC transporter permease [Lactobacillus helsingborgensis]|uniref:ABC transporter permease n=1 Tax=Lactobacillus helsingborgensis TaxID=1218494 RepID=UPI0016501A92|nr:ABC transporter permease [Lactobacillus helsingborgensis]MBC6356717.1 ABC transporter permease [Lactobacillus helsingborgensis]